MNRDGGFPPANPEGRTAPRTTPAALHAAPENAELLMMAHLEASPSAHAAALILDGAEHVVAARVVGETNWNETQIATLFDGGTLSGRPLIGCEPELLDFDDGAAPGRWAGVVRRAKRLGVRSIRITPGTHRGPGGRGRPPLRRGASRLRAQQPDGQTGVSTQRAGGASQSAGLGGFVRARSFPTRTIRCARTSLRLRQQLDFGRRCCECVTWGCAAQCCAHPMAVVQAACEQDISGCASGHDHQPPQPLLAPLWLPFRATPSHGRCVPDARSFRPT